MFAVDDVETICRSPRRSSFRFLWWESSRKGVTHLSNSNDANEQSGSPRSSRNPDNTVGTTVGSQVNVGRITPVDHNALAGTNPGDHRENESPDFSTDSFKNQPGPRGETGTKGA